MQLRKVAPKECRVRMQFRRIASKRMLLDATSAECSRKKYYWDATSVEYPKKRYVGMPYPQGVPGRNVLMTLTQALSMGKFVHEDVLLRTIGLGLDFKMDVNSGLEFGILINSGSDLKFEMIYRL
uniref:Uncharacterized protein n=1 Tax=Fagus sylvatica TaxID=28930 RepID=A0A2N9J8A5_FAGSY